MTGLRRRALLLASMGAVLAPRPGAAQAPAPSARARATVGVISGGIDGTYARIASDLMAVEPLTEMHLNCSKTQGVRWQKGVSASNKGLRLHLFLFLFLEKGCG